MERSRRLIPFLPWLFAGLLVVSIPAVWISTRKAPVPQSGGAAGVRLGVVARRDFKERLPFLGRVESTQAVDLVAFTQARVVEVVAKDGAAVKKGQVLFRLGGPVLDHELAAARSLAQSAKRRLGLASEVLARKKALSDAKLVDLNELALAEDAAAEAKSSLSAASSHLRELEAQAVFRSPVSGVFTGRRVNVGQDVAPGTVLAEITDPNSLRVATVVYQAGGEALEGLPARIYVDGKELQATVAQAFPDRTPGGGTLAWLEGPALDEALRPGESVQGSLILATHRQALAVPRSAVAYDEEENPWVFAAGANGYVKTAVKIGMSDPQWVEILDGLEAGQRIVVEGAYSLYYEDFAKTHPVED